MADEIRILALFGAEVLFGQERANVDALAALQTEGCKVLFVIRSEESAGMLAIREFLDARGLAWVGAPSIDYPRRGSLIRTAFRNPAAFVTGQIAFKRIAKEFSATHIHAFNPVHVAAFYTALRSTSIPMIYRVGEELTTHNAFYRGIWRFIVHRSAHFVANSLFIKQELIAGGVTADRITVLHAPPPQRQGTLPIELPAGSDEPGAMRFVYVGQLVPQKGVDLLVEAFGELAKQDASSHLLIAGRISDWSGDDWARSLRDRTKEDASIGNRVHFLGFVEDAPELIRRCHVHVAPSVCQEGYGLVVVEAKSVARPSIIFQSGGMTELVEDGVDGATLSDKSVHALSRAMAEYASRPELVAHQGRAAFLSMGKMGLSLVPKRWREIYERAAKKQTETPPSIAEPG